MQREQNTERRDFYELLWHTGAAQSDGACLLAEDINWEARTICFTRKKLKSRGTNLKPTLFRFSAEIEALLLTKRFTTKRLIEPSFRKRVVAEKCGNFGMVTVLREHLAQFP